MRLARKNRIKYLKSFLSRASLKFRIALMLERQEKPFQKTVPTKTLALVQEREHFSPVFLNSDSQIFLIQRLFNTVFSYCGDPQP